MTIYKKTTSHNVPVVCDVFCCPMRKNASPTKLARIYYGRKKCGGTKPCRGRKPEHGFV